ncbi:TIR domain-containing protein [Fundicoccus culcitae]|uniref:TIR domain-containing protein n=1 Tax=Fundicoccus culcitae TaxID=2969821 RepID=A0ABY5P9V8_9LACT|nr:TIR domain-containing protein [Fundicoccus culcitae]UUX35208.1 TIR domain-containing protein [Fundicoccus culcitae]
MVKRQVFFSFHFSNDSTRAGQIRNMGVVDNSSTFSDNDWEEVREKTDDKIKRWIDNQLNNRSCLVLLIGEETANRKWINYEINKAIELNKGIVGIYIHNLKNLKGQQSNKGNNPFEYVTVKGEKSSKFITTFDSKYKISTNVYNDIKSNIPGLIENAILNKPSTW